MKGDTWLHLHPSAGREERVAVVREQLAANAARDRERERQRVREKHLELKRKRKLASDEQTSQASGVVLSAASGACRPSPTLAYDRLRECVCLSVHSYACLSSVCDLLSASDSELDSVSMTALCATCSTLRV